MILEKLIKWIIIGSTGWASGVSLIFAWEYLKQIIRVEGDTLRAKWTFWVCVCFPIIVDLVALRVIWPSPFIPSTPDSWLYLFAMVGIAAALTGLLWVSFGKKES